MSENIIDLQPHLAQKEQNNLDAIWAAAVASGQVTKPSEEEIIASERLYDALVRILQLKGYQDRTIQTEEKGFHSGDKRLESLNCSDDEIEKFASILSKDFTKPCNLKSLHFLPQFKNEGYRVIYHVSIRS